MKSCKRIKKENSETRGKYKKVSVLGSGAHGKVYKVTDVETGIEYAMKEVPKSGPNVHKTQKEIDILKNQNLECALNFREAFIENDQYHIVTSYFNGYSLDRYSSNITNKENRIKSFHFDQLEVLYSQVLHCLDCLHSNGIYHRDIKPVNIVLHEGEAKIIDFGEALDMSVNPEDSCNTVGTPEFLSKYGFKLNPRMDQEYCRKVYEFQDYYQLILTFYFVITGHPLVKNSNLYLVMMDVLKGNFSLIEKNKNEKLVRLINNVLTYVKSHPMDQIPSIREMMDL